jgi:hypothetical protein
MLYYDVLYYETDWYKKIIKNHPNIYHAFGINKNALIKPLEYIQKYDYICIGAFQPRKRMELLLKIKGAKILVIGEDYNTTYSKKVIDSLNKNTNIDIMPFVEYSKLPTYFCMAKTLYIPANVYGGGERAILEARHCGLSIRIESDNPVLKEMLNSPIWDSQYYYQQLRKGIESVSC